MFKIGAREKPGDASLPIPNDEAERKLLKRLLGNPGRLNTVQDLPAHHDGQYWESYKAFLNKPASADEVQKVRDLLAGKPPAEANTPEKHPDFTERRKTLPRYYASSGDLI